MPKTTYKDLDAWDRAMDLACETYRVTREFPRDERFGFDVTDLA